MTPDLATIFSTYMDVFVEESLHGHNALKFIFHVLLRLPTAGEVMLIHKRKPL